MTNDNNDHVNECGHTDAEHERLAELTQEVEERLAEMISIKYQRPIVVTGWHTPVRGVSIEDNVTYMAGFSNENCDIITLLGLTKYAASRAEASIYDHDHE